LVWWWGGSPVRGGTVRLAVPDQGLAAFECGLLIGGRPVLLADHSLALPRGGGMELRGSGLWAEVIVEDPGEHLSVGLEAFAVAVDDPDDAWRGGPDHLYRGTRLPVGLDLGAERCGEPVGADERGGVSSIPCRVVGEVLVADRAYDVDGWGWWMIGSDLSVRGGTVRVRGRHTDGTWSVDARERPESMPWGRAPVLRPDAAANSALVDRRLVDLMADDGRPGIGWVEELVVPEV